MSAKVVRTVGALGAIGSLLMVGPAQAATPFPGANGAIAFTESVHNQTVIGIIESDGSHSRIVARSAQSPVWSPDGRTLAYESDGRLYARKGHVQWPLTKRQSCEQSAPAYSPDGQYMAYVCARQHGGEVMSAVFTVQANGLLPKNLTGWQAAGIESPAWSPDGLYVVYQQNQRQVSRLLTVQVHTGQTQQVTELSDQVSSEAAWSPDGQKILYSDSQSEVYTIWPDGSHRAVISDGESYHASWAPNSQKVAFLDDATGSTMSIRQLDDSLVQVPLEVGEEQSIQAFSWSPDGKELVVSAEYSQDGQRQNGLFKIGVEGEASAPVKLAEKTVRDMAWQAR